MIGSTVIKGIYIKASPSAVFRILTNPLKIVRWMGPQKELGVRAGGGLCRLDLNGRAMIRGRCLQAKRNRKVVFAWGCMEIRRRIAVIDSMVEINLEPRGHGTWVQLIHRKLPLTLVKYMNPHSKNDRKLNSANSGSISTAAGRTGRLPFIQNRETIS